ncbi:MAG: DUF2207 domain-containing protein, partial [Proteobacteria bacterium]|nr:DUF2207 domain-containing protein [Pseudomonadota bacterium]
MRIRRGIYRDYPVRYEDKFGNNVKVVYEPQSVLRNGMPETLTRERRGRNARSYFGSSDRLLSPGDYTYTYRYEAGRMLGYFDAVDELYWNVTGHDWSFPIDRASASVSFDFDMPVNELALVAYTGPHGVAGSDYTAVVDATGVAQFQTTRELALNEGLTIALGWPKGIVAEPGDLQKLVWLLADNVNLLIVVAGLIATLSYYIPVWQNYGKDPSPGVIFTRYEPPAGFSPASLRYIENMGYDDEVMTAGVVSLAVKGYLQIEDDGGTHTLHRKDPDGHSGSLATGERALHAALFSGGDELVLIDENHAIVGGARKAHEKSLKRDYHKRYFVTNGLLNLPPILISIISTMVAILVGPSLAVFAVVALMVVTIITFGIIMKTPTASGRRLLDASVGFREYLEIAEKDELNLRNPPEKTPMLFERYLPFALALGVDQQWAERFSRIFANLKGPSDSAWQPSWYNGSWNSFDLSANTSNLSSGLGSAISSSVSPPGSSSGSGGGGSS